MKRLLLISLLGLSSPLSAQYRVDTTAVAGLIREAMDHSEVMTNLEYLCDVIGPRLSGSPAVHRANDWVAAKFRDYGVTARLEPYLFGVSWQRGPIDVQLVAPFARPVLAYSWAWTDGTRGKAVRGPVVKVNLAAPESLAVYKDKLRSAWLMLSEPALIWNPDGPTPTAADSAARKTEQDRRTDLQRQLTADSSTAAVAARRQWMIDRPYLLRKAGALGIVTDGAKEHGLVTMSGSPNRVSPLPNFVVTHEDYLMFNRLAQRGQPAVIEARIKNQFGSKTAEQWNTVGEIRGSELPGQVVILGAHLDSWDHAQGTTDNGAASMAVLEAARIIAASGVRPKRTIRFILFTGEEQGLLGSYAYAAAHVADADSVQAVLVLDNGTGMITGQALQGRNELEQLWQDLLAPVKDLGATGVRQGNKGGTDHLSFIPYGIPSFNFDQESRGYNHTHHSQTDTFDKAVGSDLQQASAVLAVTAFELANLDQLLPRGPRSSPTPPLPAVPSPGLSR